MPIQLYSSYISYSLTISIHNAKSWGCLIDSYMVTDICSSGIEKHKWAGSHYCKTWKELGTQRRNIFVGFHIHTCDPFLPSMRTRLKAHTTCLVQVMFLAPMEALHSVHYDECHAAPTVSRWLCTKVNKIWEVWKSRMSIIQAWDLVSKLTRDIHHAP